MKRQFPSECLKRPRHDQVAPALTQTHTFSEDSQIPPYEDGFEYLGQGGYRRTWNIIELSVPPCFGLCIELS